MYHIEQAIEYFSKGGIVLVADDEDRENEIDMIVAAEHVTYEQIVIMIRSGTGIICCPMDSETAYQLGLKYMVNPDDSTDTKKTAFTISVDAETCTTGVSAEDRLRTVKALVHQDIKCTQPGHMYPLIANDGLLEKRQGHTEAAVTLCLLAKCIRNIGVIVELMNPNGTMMRVKDIPTDWYYPFITIADLCSYVKDKSLQFQFTSHRFTQSALTIKTRDNSIITGEVIAYSNKLYNRPNEHSIFIYPNIETFKNQDTKLIRIHSECLTGNVFHSQLCDCKDQFDSALLYIVHKGCGAIAYISGQEGRGIGLVNKIQTYDLQKTESVDTYQANTMLGFKEDERNYEDVCLFLKQQLNVNNIALITNNPDKDVSKYGISIKEIVCIPSKCHLYNKTYLETKKLHNKAKFT